MLIIIGISHSTWTTCSADELPPQPLPDAEKASTSSPCCRCCRYCCICNGNTGCGLNGLRGAGRTKPRSFGRLSCFSRTSASPMLRPDTLWPSIDVKYAPLSVRPSGRTASMSLIWASACSGDRSERRNEGVRAIRERVGT